MKISPFEKSTVSNIKDLILMLISVFYFHDIGLNLISGLGVVICISSSALFSLPYIQEKDNKLDQSDSPHKHDEKTYLLNERHNLKDQH
jgi:hypothetical protein